MLKRIVPLQLDFDSFLLYLLNKRLRKTSLQKAMVLLHIHHTLVLERKWSMIVKHSSKSGWLLFIVDWKYCEALLLFWNAISFPFVLLLFVFLLKFISCLSVCLIVIDFIVDYLLLFNVTFSICCHCSGCDCFIQF